MMKSTLQVAVMSPRMIPGMIPGMIMGIILGVLATLAGCGTATTQVSSPYFAPGVSPGLVMTTPVDTATWEYGRNDELLNVGIALSVERDNTKLLDLILQKIREITVADAGSIFLVEQDPDSKEKKLRFAYTQNDSVPGGDLPSFLVPITKKSIVGFVATTGKQLNIANAYEIPDSADYGFNASVDRDVGYWTRSMLTVRTPPS